jgi:uncharacterized protein YceH (UPF0502 family)
VQAVVDALVKKFFINEHGGFGSRVPKFQHRFCNTNYGTLKFTPQELGVICELFLRGPQTPGELRSHAARLCRFSDVTEVEAVLQQLAAREDGPYVMRLAREPGKRESRYAHLFSGEVSGGVEHVATAGAGDVEAQAGGRLQQLEERVAALEAEVSALKRRLEDPTAS